MKHFFLPVGPYASNCHIVWNDDTHDALLIDAGGDAEEIIAAIDCRALHPVGILLTHAHVDHIGAVPALCRHFGISVWCHSQEQVLYLSPLNAILPELPHVDGLPMPAQEPPQCAGLSYRVLHTPGHTPGGVCYYFPEQSAIFTGDTLFNGSIGRTDFPGGSCTALLTSIREQLLTLPDETRVFPGHGESTTIGNERRMNPFLL